MLDKENPDISKTIVCKPVSIYHTLGLYETYARFNWRNHNKPSRLNDMDNVTLEGLLRLSTRLMNLHSNIINRTALFIKAMKETLAHLELVDEISAILLLLHGLASLRLLQSISLSLGQNIVIDIHLFSPQDRRSHHTESLADIPFPGSQKS